MGVYKDNGEEGGLIFLCTGTAETALPTTLYSGSSISQCSTTSTSTTITPTASTSTASTSAAFTSIASTPTSTNTPGDENSSASVPVGAIAGGVVGGVAVIALVIAGIYFFLKKKRRHAADSTSGATIQEGSKPSRADDPRWRRPSELETVEPRLEMDGVKPTYELDAARGQDREREVSPMSPPLR